MSRQSFTPQQKAEAIRQLKAGGDVASVADAIGVKREAVKKTRGRKVRESGSATTYGKAVAVRLAPEEVEALDRLMAATGAKSRSDALRGMLRSSVGMLEFHPEEAAKLTEIKAELHKIGVNVNQIALAANRGRVDLARAEWQTLNELRQGLPKMRTWLNAVVDEQRRRGLRLFRTFAEGADG